MADPLAASSLWPLLHTTVLLRRPDGTTVRGELVQVWAERVEVVWQDGRDERGRVVWRGAFGEPGEVVADG